MSKLVQVGVFILLLVVAKLLLPESAWGGWGQVGITVVYAVWLLANTEGRLPTGMRWGYATQVVAMGFVIGARHIWPEHESAVAFVALAIVVACMWFTRTSRYIGATKPQATP